MYKQRFAAAASAILLISLFAQASAITIPRLDAARQMPVMLESAKLSPQTLTPADIAAWNTPPATTSYAADTTVFFALRLRVAAQGQPEKLFTGSAAVTDRIESVRVELNSTDLRLMQNQVTLYYLNNGALVSRTLVPANVTDHSLTLDLRAADSNAQQTAADALPDLRAGETYYLHFAGKTLRSGGGRVTASIMEDQASAVHQVSSQVSSATTISASDKRAGATIYNTDAQIIYRVVKKTQPSAIPGLLGSENATQYAVFDAADKEVVRLVTSANGIFSGYAKAKSTTEDSVLGVTRVDVGGVERYIYYNTDVEAITKADLEKALTTFGLRLASMSVPNENTFTQASGLMAKYDILFTVTGGVTNSPLPTPTRRPDYVANMPQTGSGLSGVCLVLLALGAMALGYLALRETRKQFKK